MVRFRPQGQHVMEMQECPSGQGLRSVAPQPWQRKVRLELIGSLAFFFDFDLARCDHLIEPSQYLSFRLQTFEP